MSTQKSFPLHQLYMFQQFGELSHLLLHSSGSLKYQCKLYSIYRRCRFMQQLLKISDKQFHRSCLKTNGGSFLWENKRDITLSFPERCPKLHSPFLYHENIQTFLVTKIWLKYTDLPCNEKMAVIHRPPL